MRLKQIAGLAWLAMLTACADVPTDDKPSPIASADEVAAATTKLDAFTDNVVAILCGEGAPCSQIGGPFRKPVAAAACEPAARLWLSKGGLSILIEIVRWGVFDLDAASLQECAAGFASHCGFAESCLDIGRGRGANDSKCSDPVDCRSGFCDGIDEESGPCEGRCAPAPARGDACKAYWDCALFDTCAAGKCQALVVETGKACVADKQACNAGGACRDGKCTATNAAGDPCTAHESTLGCGHQLGCVGATEGAVGKCVTLPAEGEACDAELGCAAPDLACMAETVGGPSSCVSRPGVGDPCELGHGCRVPYLCSPTAGVCIPAPGEGASCLQMSDALREPDGERAAPPGYAVNCDDGHYSCAACAHGLTCEQNANTCVLPGRNGESCTSDSGCGFFLICTAGTCALARPICTQ